MKDQSHDLLRTLPQRGLEQFEHYLCEVKSLTRRCRLSLGIDQLALLFLQYLSSLISSLSVVPSLYFSAEEIDFFLYSLLPLSHCTTTNVCLTSSTSSLSAVPFSSFPSSNFYSLLMLKSSRTLSFFTPKNHPHYSLFSLPKSRLPLCFLSPKIVFPLSDYSSIYIQGSRGIGWRFRRKEKGEDRRIGPLFQSHLSSHCLSLSTSPSHCPTHSLFCETKRERGEREKREKEGRRDKGNW